jgi:nondiscriminating glutamyl-tRNA synthetase
MSWETTPQIANYLKEQISSVASDNVTSEQFEEWMSYCKKELKIKGKPLFMGFRFCLTGQNHGPDLKQLIPLLPKKSLLDRVSKVSS